MFSTIPADGARCYQRHQPVRKKDDRLKGLVSESLPDAPSDPQARPDEVSVVIPCLNEAKSIGTCIDQARRMLQQAGLVGELIVADNGSTDESA
jgi:hypothetical protein